ncbi:polysaccharide deacetylase family protein [Dyella flagellata]|uniref:NodB homology domain-containing protein n=1 Tax=Dyella flagellata TaxID=1867833 RepID=A0ABQ5XJX6_9GAMM|nr:polysaccharide deacetylase family protein [Dyella flagellata]GLQ90739.1 hypothetical protein GCM10007898_43150 [Dyella flagellata]
MLWYAYRRYVALCGILLTFLLYALLLTGRGIAAPHFVLDQGNESLKHANTQVWRKISDFLAGRKYAVLTFDDGPYGYGVDEEIMTTLRKHHAHAVFFLVCSHINSANRGVLARLESDGDLIGNHSYDHLRLDRLAAPALEHQISGCSNRIAELTGMRPYYFRPPFGSTSPRIAGVVRSSGMKQMLWNANSEDGRTTEPEQILNDSVEQTADHSILLMHEKPTTAAALDAMLTRLEQRGFQFVLPDQLSSENVAIN